MKNPALKEEQTKIILNSFFLFLEEKGYFFKKSNPNFKPGEGYSPPQYLHCYTDEILSEFLNEQTEVFILL